MEMILYILLMLIMGGFGLLFVFFLIKFNFYGFKMVFYSFRKNRKHFLYNTFLISTFRVPDNKDEKLVQMMGKTKSSFKYMVGSASLAFIIEVILILIIKFVS